MNDPLKLLRNNKPVDLEGLWSPCPAFLVCNGRSLDDFDLDQLRRRGVASLGVNNAAAKAPVKAWVFGDPQSKFHHGLFLDPMVMTFAPTAKMKRKIKVKLSDGFHDCTVRVRECPNTYAFERKTMFDPERFFDTPFAHWGSGKHQPEGIEGSGCLATVLCGLRILRYLGVRRVYLLGVDHCGSRRRWAKEDRAFGRLLPVFERHGFKVFNCNPKSGCGVFPYESFAKAIFDCQGSVPYEPFDVEGWYSKEAVREECKGREPFTPKHFGD